MADFCDLKVYFLKSLCVFAILFAINHSLISQIAL